MAKTKPTKTLPALPPDDGEICPAEAMARLEELSALLKASIVKGDGDESDFHSVWIGLLLGSGACSTFDSAHQWSTFVRYNTDHLLA